MIFIIYGYMYGGPSLPIKKICSLLHINNKKNISIFLLSFTVLLVCVFFSISKLVIPNSPLLPKKQPSSQSFKKYIKILLQCKKFATKLFKKNQKQLKNCHGPLLPK